MVKPLRMSSQITSDDEEETDYFFDCPDFHDYDASVNYQASRIKHQPKVMLKVRGWSVALLDANPESPGCPKVAR